MNLVTSQFSKQDKSEEALSSRNQVLSREIETQKQKIETLKAALENAASSFGEADRRTMAWQTQLNNAQAELNGMERELKDNSKALDSTGEEMETAAKGADKLGKEVDDVGNEAEKSGVKMQKLGSILKTVGAAMATAFAAVGTATIAAGKSLAEMTKGASAYADEILTTSTVTGMSTESLQAYKYAAELVDVPLETLTKSMAKNIKSMSSAQGGTGSVAEAYKKLGVAVTNTDGSLRSSDKVYWDAIDALGNISDETERNAISMQIFGKSAMDLNPLIAQGSDGIAKLTEEAKKMGAVMSEEQLEKLGAFDDSIQRLKSGSEAAKNALGLILLPQLQSLATDGISLLGQFTSGLINAGDDWSKISSVIGNAIGGIADMALQGLPKIASVGSQIVLSLVNAFSANMPAVITAAT
jgi:phage-related tail protein